MKKIIKITKKPTLHTDSLIIDDKEYTFKFYKVKLGETEYEAKFTSSIKKFKLLNMVIFDEYRLSWRNEDDKNELIKNLRKISRENKRRKAEIVEHVRGRTIKSLESYLHEPKRYFTEDGEGRHNQRILHHMPFGGIKYENAI